MRAFVAMRHLVLNPPVDRMDNLEKRVMELKQYIDAVFTDQNAINEDTRTQLELLNRSLAELQADNRFKPRNPVGFVKQQN